MFPSHVVLAARFTEALHAASTAGSTSKSNSGADSLIFIVILVAAFYFLLIRPQRKRSKAAATVSMELEPGVEVMTRHGQIARVVSVEDDRVVLEIAPGVHSTFVKEAIARVIPVPAEDDMDGTDPVADAQMPPDPFADEAFLDEPPVDPGPGEGRPESGPNPDAAAG